MSSGAVLFAESGRRRSASSFLKLSGFWRMKKNSGQFVDSRTVLCGISDDRGRVARFLVSGERALKHRL